MGSSGGLPPSARSADVLAAASEGDKEEEEQAALAPTA